MVWATFYNMKRRWKVYTSACISHIILFYFHHKIKREKLKYIVTTGKIRESRYRGSQREKFLDSFFLMTWRDVATCCWRWRVVAELSRQSKLAGHLMMFMMIMTTGWARITSKLLETKMYGIGNTFNIFINNLNKYEVFLFNFQECCHCCQLGLVSRMSGSSCKAPGLGEPCDSKYSECCRGDVGGNFSLTGM